MRLATIDDLLQGGPDVEELVQKARTLCSTCENYLAENQPPDHERPSGIHASEISGCERKIVYNLIGMEKRDLIDPKWKRRFSIGHHIHDKFQSEFQYIAKAMGLNPLQDWHITFEKEAPIRPSLQAMANEWTIYSHCDGIFTIRERPGGPVVLRVILEIKSESPAQYELLMKKAKPKPDHIEQAHVYMACLDIPLTGFLYYNKGNQNYTGTDSSFLIRFDPVLWKTLEDRFRRVHDAAAAALTLEGEVIEENLPPRTESVKCEFCQFSWTCNPTYLNGKPRATWQAVRGPNG